MTTQNTIPKAAQSLLLVDDDPDVCNVFSKVLELSGFSVTGATSLGEMKLQLSRKEYGIVLLDLQLGKEDGLGGLRYISEKYPQTKIFVLSATESVERAVECLRQGAVDFYSKNIGPFEVSKQLQLKLFAMMKKGIDSSANASEEFRLIGKSKSMLEVFERVSQVACVDSNVLLLGETGTGKEMIAKLLHSKSSRSKEKFYAINCGAIPENLLESELFGHKRGSFTDAKTDRKGLFELSSSGTLLLDEIGDMPLVLQAKLLRVLQEREVTPIGSNESIKVNTRIIAATHHNLSHDVQMGRFRQDLFYRLSVIVLKLPPLRERKADIADLARHFVALYNKKFGKSVVEPSGSLADAIEECNWPGNIRELQNAVERAVILSTNGQLSIDDLFFEVSMSQDKETQKIAVTTAPVEDLVESYETSLYNKLELTNAKAEFEKSYLKFHSKQCEGNVGMISKATGRNRADVYRLLHKHGIEFVKVMKDVDPPVATAYNLNGNSHPVAAPEHRV